MQNKPKPEPLGIVASYREKVKEELKDKQKCYPSRQKKNGKGRDRR